MNSSVGTIEVQRPSPVRRRGRHPVRSAFTLVTVPRSRRIPASPDQVAANESGGHAPNGVDVVSRARLAADVAAHPETGSTAWQAEATWSQGLRSQARVRDFAPIPADGPVELGGTDSAPHPVEALLAAMANCLVAAYAAHASRIGISLSYLHVRVIGELDLDVMLGVAQGHAGFQRVSAAVTIGSSASPQQLFEIHESVVAASPIGHTIANAVPIRVHLA